jgi:Flp pilus assembly protein TadD
MEFYHREQLWAALRNSNCEGATSYGNKILAAAPDDAEVKKALADCALKKSCQQMRAAFRKPE